MDAPVIVGRITRAIIVGPVSVRVAIAVRTVRITAIIGAAVVGVPAVISSIKRNTYSDIPKYAASATKVITTPMISVIASVRYKRPPVSRLDNARLSERGRRQRKCDNGTEN